MGGLIGAFSSELGALAGKSDRWWLAAAAQVLCYVGLGSGDVIARKFPVHAADRYRELEGETIDGLFAVDRLSGSSAAFEAQGTRVSDETPVLLRFFPESLWSESVADRHREAKFFRHPNLLRCIATGEVESGDSERLFYAAFELPGVTLAELLEGRALTPPEARQLGREVVAGLRYLHARGMVLCNLDKFSVAKRDGVWRICSYSQLRLEGAGHQKETRRLLASSPGVPPEALSGTVGPAWDVWSLAHLFTAALTGPRPPLPKNASSLPRDGGVRQIPEPFSSVNAGCLQLAPELRSTLDEIEAQLGVESEAPVPLAVRPVPVAEVMPQAAVPELAAPPTHSARNMYVVAAASLLAVAMGGLYFSQSAPATAEPQNPVVAVEHRPDPTAAPTVEPSDTGQRNRTVNANVEEIVRRWENSFLARDLTRQMDLYAPRLERFYLQKDVPRTYVLKVKTDTLRKAGEIRRYEVSHLQTEFEGADRARVTFDKVWEFGGEARKAGKVRGELKLAQMHDGSWRIVSERDLRVYRLTSF